MEDLLYYSLTIAICLVAITFISSLHSATVAKKPPAPPLPPGPPPLLSLLTPLLFLGRTNFGTERVIRAARSWYGPVFTIHLLPSRPAIFIADHAVAQRALVQRGAAFADRPPPTLPSRVFSSGQCSITSGAYGPLWRPGMAVALLQLEFFVACLVAEFEWLQVSGEPVEFAEKQELSVVDAAAAPCRVVWCTGNVNS